jgi:alpha-glucosidase
MSGEARPAPVKNSKVKKIAIIAVLVTAYATLSAQQYGSASMSGYHRDGNRFYFTNANNKLTVEFCTPSMFRVKSRTKNEEEQNEPWMVVQYNWQPVQVTEAIKNDHFLLKTSALTIKVIKAPFKVEVYDNKGNLLSADDTSFYQKGDTIGCIKKMSAGEHFFGFGERMDFLDQRSKKLNLNVGRGKGMPHITGAYNVLEANYSPIPFFMSTRGYGIFFHNAFPTRWDMGATTKDKYSFSAAGGEMDYYFMYGPVFPLILQQYTALTGRSPLLPKFALGLHVGTYSGGTWGYEQLTSDRYVIDSPANYVPWAYRWIYSGSIVPGAYSAR